MCARRIFGLLRFGGWKWHCVVSIAPLSTALARSPGECRRAHSFSMAEMPFHKISQDEDQSKTHTNHLSSYLHRKTINQFVGCSQCRTSTWYGCSHRPHLMHITQRASLPSSVDSYRGHCACNVAVSLNVGLDDREPLTIALDCPAQFFTLVATIAQQDSRIDTRARQQKRIMQTARIWYWSDW